jgi:demethylmacrocin O-methyltransferase
MKNYLMNTVKMLLSFGKTASHATVDDLGDLSALATKYGTDKFNAHWYTPHYQKHFQVLRKQRLNLLEIGVGGYAEASYDHPKLGGASLRMWKEYFPHSMIYGVDICDKSALQEDRIVIFQGDQRNEENLRDIHRRIGSLDIVIDDGSHVNKDVLKTFSVLFPLLKDDGIYVVEDTQTSYWPTDYGGDSENLNNPATIIGFFKRLVDGLNHAEFIKPGYMPTYLDKHVVSMHFYHNMVFIYKGHNDEKSNMLKASDGSM